MAKPNASQVARAPGAVRGEGFFGMGIKLAGVDIPLYRGVELPCVEGLVPRAKALQLARGELFDGLLDVFGSGHAVSIAFVSETERAVRRA